jgi:predicted dehydrogenase
MTRQSESSPNGAGKSSRRVFLKRSGKLAAASALLGISVPNVHAAEDNTIRLALIGCGSRGNGAVGNALSVPDSAIKLYAMADLFENRLKASHKVLNQQFEKQIDVTPDRQFLGFDAYKKAIDCLKPGDVAMLTGYAGFRPAQLEYAVQKGINVFMEKSFAPDPPGCRRVIRAGEEAQKKNLKIAAGLMCRHSTARQALIQKIRDGALGDLELIRAYRMEPVGPLGDKPEGEKELHWQIRNFIRFFWVAGGLFAEMTIHQIDEVCWLKGELPVAAHGIGGRSVANADPAQNLDSYAIEYTFADGTKATVVARYLANCHNEFCTYVHGTKCAAQFSGAIHAPTVHIHKDQQINKRNVAWEPTPEPCSPWQAEWNNLISAIRNDKPHNEAKRAAESNLVDIMGRAAVHSGQIVTREQAWASNFQWCPGIDAMTDETPPPLEKDANGRYPAPTPGAWTEI